MISCGLSDLRYAARTMARRPASTLIIILTLAIGTGATISIFSVVDAALVRPLPYPDADRMISLAQVSDSYGTYGFGPPFLEDLRERTGSFDAIAGFSPSWSMTLTGVGEPRVTVAAYVSDGLLGMLGVQPIAGRLFAPQEHVAGGPRAAVVSRRFWRRHFGTDARLNQQTIWLDGEAYTVVGVAPDVAMPITSSIVSREDHAAVLWLPFAANPFAQLRNVPVMNVIGLLRDGTTLAQATSELGAVRSALREEFPEAGLERFVTIPLAELVSRSSRPTVLTLFAASFLLLVVACANVANLMLNRSLQRRQEIAIRASLGAGKGRIIAQVLFDSLLARISQRLVKRAGARAARTRRAPVRGRRRTHAVRRALEPSATQSSPAIALAQPRAVEKCGLVATLGVAAGFLLASWLLSAVPALGLAGLPPSAEIRIDMRVAGFAMLLAVGTAVLFGSVPAAFASRLGAVAGLRNAARDGGRGSGRPRNALVAAEVALAMILLVGAGLLARSFWRLTQVDPGFRTERLVAVPLSLAGNGRQTGAERYAFLNQVLGRLQELPGVEDVTAVNRLPLGGSNVLVGVEAEAEPSPDGFGVSTDRRVVTPGYFDIMGIELIDGRAFDARDNADTGTPAAILNQQAARLLWPDQQALGRRLHLRLRGGPGPWRTVVGVVGAVHHHGLDRAVRPEVYVPYAQASVETMVALLRGPADLAALKPLIQDAIWDLDPNLPLDGVQDVEAVVSASVSEPRFRALLLSAFASLALLLAAIGVASVISVSVAQRTRDIAIRVALGAQRGEILWMNVREGLALGALGAAIGLAGSVALSRLVEALLFEVTPNDPLTLAAAAAGLLLVVAAASYLPARRATRIDPLEAMRAQ